MKNAVTKLLALQQGNKSIGIPFGRSSPLLVDEKRLYIARASTLAGQYIFCVPGVRNWNRAVYHDKGMLLLASKRARHRMDHSARNEASGRGSIDWNANLRQPYDICSSSLDEKSCRIDFLSKKSNNYYSCNSFSSPFTVITTRGSTQFFTAIGRSRVTAIRARYQMKSLNQSVGRRRTGRTGSTAKWTNWRTVHLAQSSTQHPAPATVIAIARPSPVIVRDQSRFGKLNVR